MGSVVTAEEMEKIRLMVRDREVFARRLKCIPSRVIAEELALPLEEVHKSIARMSGGVSQALRDELRKLEIDRLDDLQSAWYERARTEPEAASLVLKMMDQRAKLTGLYMSPTQTETFVEEIRNREKSTDALERSLARVAGVTVTIEAEVKVINNDEPRED